MHDENNVGNKSTPSVRRVHLSREGNFKICSLKNYLKIENLKLKIRQRYLKKQGQLIPIFSISNFQFQISLCIRRSRICFIRVLS